MYGQRLLSIVAGVGMMGGFLVPAFGQGPATGEIDQDVPLPTSINGGSTIADQMNAWLNKQHPELTVGGGTLPDGRDYFLASGESTIGIKATQGLPNWAEDRFASFQKAMLNAKKQCAQFQETKITSETESEFTMPGEKRLEEETAKLKRQGLTAEGAAQIAKALHEDVVAKTNSQFLKTGALYVQKLVTDKVRQNLKEQGLDPDKPVSEQEIKKITSSSIFKKSVQVEARAQCGALQILGSFEQIRANGTGEVGVLAISTEKLRQIAAAMQSHDFTLVPRGGPGKNVHEYATLNLKILLSTVGTSVVKDENGEYAVLGFAQAAPRSKNAQDILGAKQKAEILAESFVREFIGEQIIYNGDLRENQTVEALAEGEARYTNDGSMHTLIKAKAGQMPLTGLLRIHSWETLHPSNNAPIVGVVVAWRPSSAKFAEKFRAMQEATPAQLKASSTDQNKSVPSSGGPPSAPTQKPVGAYSGSGNSSRDF